MKVYGESMAAKTRRIRKQSQEGGRSGWTLQRLIMKSNDDVRQEVFVMQVRWCGVVYRHGAWLVNFTCWYCAYKLVVFSGPRVIVLCVDGTVMLFSSSERSIDRPLILAVRPH